MPYLLKEATIKINNTTQNTGKVEQLWKDVTTGKLPILFNSDHEFQQGISPISKYSNYKNEYYDLSIVGVTADFFKQIEAKVQQGLYKKYDESNETGDIFICAKKAWENVYNNQKAGMINRAFTVDYESTVPAKYTKDGKAHCYLYIATQQKK